MLSHPRPDLTGGIYAYVGILEYAIGPVGAGIVNFGVVLSLVGALLGYVIIASETLFEAARQGVFPKAFAKVNQKGTPIVTVAASAAITRAFLLLAVFASSAYQFFYAGAVNTVLVPYVCSMAFYFKLAWSGGSMREAGGSGANRFMSALTLAYTVFLVWTGGVQGTMVMAILFARARSSMRSVSASVVCCCSRLSLRPVAAVIAVAFVASVYLIATGAFSII